MGWVGGHTESADAEFVAYLLTRCYVRRELLHAEWQGMRARVARAVVQGL